MKNKILLFFLYIFIPFIIFGQSNNGFSDYRAYNPTVQNDGISMDDRVLLANSSVVYPVTPGDVYKIDYIGAAGLTSFEVIVAGDFSVNLNLFGYLDVRDMTYSQMRKKLEQIILEAYSESRPHIVLQSTGLFQIYLTGEVQSAKYIDCWGLSKLSSVIFNNTTAYSSLRDITIESADGSTKQYDIFAALYLDSREEDSLLKPGDTVIVKNAQRQVAIRGEVYRPGLFQLLDGEDLKELIEIYGGGLTGLADSQRIQVARYNVLSPEEPQMYYLENYTSASFYFSLNDYDEVYIPSIKENLPVAYFEGAISIETIKDASASQQSGKYIYTFLPGEKLSTALYKINQHISPAADLKAAYIIRLNHKDIIPVDIANLLYNYESQNDIIIEPYDRIIIPFRQFFVTVSGAVRSPGKYPYSPNRSYKYYLELAGGSDPEKNVADAVRITDIYDVEYASDRIIQPEDKIYVHYNNLLYHFNQWVPLLGTAVSVSALVISIIQLNR